MFFRDFPFRFPFEEALSLLEELFKRPFFSPFSPFVLLFLSVSFYQLSFFFECVVCVYQKPVGDRRDFSQCVVFALSLLY